MAKKRKLSDLVGEETQATETSANQSETVEVSESETNKLSDSKSNKVTTLQTDKVTELRTTRVADSKTVELPSQQTQEVSDSEIAEVPKYLTLVRKEARLREDQLDSLTSLARSLNRKRKGSGERITENTLIRSAIDLLLTQSERLKSTLHKV